MKRLLAILVFLVLFVWLVAPAFTQTRVCGPNGCQIVSLPKIVDGKLILDGKSHVKGSDGVWRLECPCVKCDCDPCLCGKRLAVAPVGDTVYQGPLPTGVLPDGLSSREKYTYKGAEVDKEKAFATLGASPSDLKDDSREVTVSVIGGEARKVIVAELKAKLGAGYKFWEGPASDWSFAPGFKTSGNPVTIYCQNADGKVTHRQDDLNGGVEAAIEAIRKANPAYDPAKDPDKRKADLPGVPGGNAWVVYAGAALVLLLLFSRGRADATS